MNTYNIVFCVNRKFSRYLPLVVYSITRHTKENLCFHVFYSSIDNHAKNLLIDLVDKFNKRINFVFEELDAEKEFDEHGVKVEPWFGSYDAYTRGLVVERLYGQGIKKVLYLDADVLAVDNIIDLLHMVDKVEGIAGVIGLPHIHFKYKDIKQRYVNSGVLCMNLSYLHKISFEKQFLTVLKECSKDELRFPDQDAINMIIDDSDIVDFGYVFNCFAENYINGSDARIIHYAGPKPWDFFRKWNHAKFIFYRELVSFKLFVVNSKISDSALCRIFSILELLLGPVVFLLNKGHDLNHARKLARKLKKKSRCRDSNKLS